MWEHARDTSKQSGQTLQTKHQLAFASLARGNREAAEAPRMTLTGGTSKTHAGPVSRLLLRNLT